MDVAAAREALETLIKHQTFLNKSVGRNPHESKTIAFAKQSLAALDSELPVSAGVTLISAERARQVLEEGFDAVHDDSEHEEGDIAGAGTAYADHAVRQMAAGVPLAGRPPDQTWRWSYQRWKPTDDPLRNLVKAGALIAAEIDKILRNRVEDK